MAIRWKAALAVLAAVPLAAVMTLTSAEAVTTGVSGAVVTVPPALIGVPATVRFASDASGAVPVRYEYTINGGQVYGVPADATGNATAVVTFTTHTNLLVE